MRAIADVTLNGRFHHMPRILRRACEGHLPALLDTVELRALWLHTITPKRSLLPFQLPDNLRIVPPRFDRLSMDVMPLCRPEP